jgi:hypothetical protein
MSPVEQSNVRGDSISYYNLQSTGGTGPRPFLKVMETDMEVFVIINSLRRPGPRNFSAAETKAYKSDEVRGRVFDPRPLPLAIGFVAVLTLTLESLPF